MRNIHFNKWRYRLTYFNKCIWICAVTLYCQTRLLGLNEFDSRFFIIFGFRFRLGKGCDNNRILFFFDELLVNPFVHAVSTENH